MYIYARALVMGWSWVGLFRCCLQRSSRSRVECLGITIKAIRSQSGYPKRSQLCDECQVRIKYCQSDVDRVFWRCVTGTHCSLSYKILYYSNPTNPISTQPIHQTNFNQLWFEGELLCLVSLLLHVIHYSENSPQCYSLNLTRN